MTASPTHEVVVSSPGTTARKTRRSRLGLFRRHKTQKAPVDLNVANAASPPTHCCLPRRSKRTANASRPTVHFSRSIEAEPMAVTELVNKSGTPKLVRRRSRSVKRSESRKSFYSVASTYSAVRRLQVSQDDIECSTGENSINQTEDIDDPMDGPVPSIFKCLCMYPAHQSFDPAMPLIVPPGVERGSYEELLVHAKSQLGNWTTILSRSDSLEPQMVHVGIAKMKRMVMNRLAIPFTAVLEENDTLLHCWITTPVGSKHTTAGLKGQITEDKDSDLGDWSATTTIVDYPIKWFCEGKSVRAMQMKRENPQLGVAYETRVCLPDKAEGRILLYNITINPGDDKPMICVDRIYKFVSK